MCQKCKRLKSSQQRANVTSEKKIIDLDKPMRCGAFVDPSRIKQYTEEDFILPETPPFHWLLPKAKDDTSSLKSNPEEDRQSINSPTGDKNSSTNANNNNNNAANNLNNVNNNSNKGSFESAGPLNFRLSQSPKGSEPLAAAAAAAAPASAADSNSGSPPASLTSEFRRSSRWSVKQGGPEDDRLLRELHIPFAASGSPIGDLAKFYRECFNAPPLQEFNELSNVISNVDDEEAANADDGGRILTAAEDDEVDDLTRQLEQFETSLPEFETLVTSLCQSVDSNSNS